VGCSFVDVDPTNSFLVAIVIPWEKVVGAWAKDNKVPEDQTMKDWVKNPRLKEAIQKVRFLC